MIATARNVMKIADVNANLKAELDVSDENRVDNSMKIILSEVDKIDILINNAGYSVRSAVEEIEINEFQTAVIAALNML